MPRLPCEALLGFWRHSERLRIAVHIGIRIRGNADHLTPADALDGMCHFMIAVEAPRTHVEDRHPRRGALASTQTGIDNVVQVDPVPQTRLRTQRHACATKRGSKQARREILTLF